MSDSKRTPRLEDVAFQAGVSPATVSRYFNNPSLLATETAARIAEVIRETGYVRNMMAGGLANSRSGIVAVLVPDMAFSIFNVTVESMINELARDGHVVTLGLTGHDNRQMLPLIEDALARRADGLVLTGILGDEAMRARLRLQKLTVIETWGLPEHPVDVAVGFSHRDVGREIARFAAQRGYRRAHLICATGTRAMERRDGFLEEWRLLKEEPPTEQLIENYTRFGHARGAFRAMRDLPQRPDVVVCSSDWLAQGLLVEALVAGIRVPDELAVIGFGNVNVAAEMRPTITTVDIDGARIGREAVNALRRRVLGDFSHPDAIDIGFRLIARESA